MDVTRDVNEVMHRKRARRILGDLRKVEKLDTEREGSTFGTRRSQKNFCATGAARDGGADRKAITERLCISLPYVETFNSKVIKGFVPELKVVTCFPCFGIPMFYIYVLWTFYVRFAYPYHGYGTYLLNNWSQLIYTIWKAQNGIFSERYISQLLWNLNLSKL